MKIATRSLKTRRDGVLSANCRGLIDSELISGDSPHFFMLESDNCSKGNGKGVSELLELCIESCGNCYKMCMFTAIYCIQKGGMLADESLVKLLFDCSDTCRMTTSFMLRDSDFTKHIAELCRDVCWQCAEYCGHFEGDGQMEACRDVCAQAAGSCQELSCAL